MKLSEMIVTLDILRQTHGDLEVLDNEYFGIRIIVPEVATSKQAVAFDMVEGERFARVVSNY